MGGNEVYWPGLCKFEWKKTTRGRKPKVVSEEKTEAGFVDGKGFEDIVLEDREIVKKENEDE